MESRSGAMEKALFRKSMSESIYVMLVGYALVVFNFTQLLAIVGERVAKNL